MALFVFLCFLETALFPPSIALLNISVRGHSIQYRYQWKFHRIIYSYFVLAPSLQYPQFLTLLFFETLERSLANSRSHRILVSTTIEEAVGVTSSQDSFPAEDSTHIPEI